MENMLQTPPVVRGNEIGLVDKGSGMRCSSGVVDDEVIINDQVEDDCRELVPFVEGGITPASGGAGVEMMQYRTPLKTVETVQTVVASNHVSVVSYVEAPRVGMIFNTWEDVEAYYKEYGEQKGFGVSRVQGVYSKGELRDRISTTWRCECYGRPDMRAQREAKKRAKAMDASGSGGVIGGVVGEDELSGIKRRSKKCECAAKVYASVNRNGEWVIRSVELEHTGHSPVPGNARLVKEYRMKHFTSRVRKKLLKYFEKGVPVKKIHGCIGSEMVDSEHLPFTVKDCEHEVYKNRRGLMEGGDSVAMMKFFHQMQAANNNFYFVQRLDDDGRLKDVMWVDARSRAAYEEFGDVVCFDSTYLTNEYDLPFANFVGVNHHGQSILLGCALVSHEDSDTFKWVFEQWLHCMHGKAPKAILTDQAAAMRKPLQEVMPNSRHRWCIWHIMRKLPEKLGTCDKYQEFKSELKCIVYESFSIQEFEKRWNDFVVKFELQSNEWLENLFNERHMWVPAFMRDYFWAGMKTTQRVESINSFFDGFLNRKTKLFEFPQKYDKALEKRVADEIDADEKCGKYIRRLVSGFAVEKLFQKIYTDTKFQEVQTECCRLMYCYPREENVVSDTIIQYLIEDRVWIVPEGKSEAVLTSRRRFYSATFETESNIVCCDCRKFETDGIICRHIIRILDLNQVVDIPQRYILSRWRKDLLRKHTGVKVSTQDPQTTGVWKRYNKMLTAFEPLCEEAAMVDEETTTQVVSALDKIKALVTRNAKRKFDQTIPMAYPEDAAATVDHTEGGETGTTSTVDNIVGDQGRTHNLSMLEGSAATICSPRDPVPKKRGRGRPKGSCNKKGVAKIGYKGTRNRKGQIQEGPIMNDAASANPCTPPPKKIPARRRGNPVPNSNPEAEQDAYVPEDDCLLVGSLQSN